MKLKNILIVAVVTGLLLLIPFLGNWPWTASDFVVMGVLLFVTGTVLTFVVTRIQKTSHRIVGILAVLGVFLYIWAELAVGVFTNIGS